MVTLVKHFSVTQVTIFSYLNTHRCSSRGSDYKDPPSSTVFKTPPLASSLSMKKLPPTVALYTAFLFKHCYLTLQGKKSTCGGNTAETLPAANNPCYINLVDTFTLFDHFISPEIRLLSVNNLLCFDQFCEKNLSSQCHRGRRHYLKQK